MKKLVRYELDFETAFKYFVKKLNKTNTLSTELIEVVDFSLGTFYTLLPEKTRVDEVNEFRRGRIAVGVRDFVNIIILEKLTHNYSVSCVFDDVATTFRNDYDEPLFLSCGFSLEKEVYYILNSSNVNLPLIEDCFNSSNAIWHSLCILTNANLNEILIKKKLEQKKLTEICQKVQMIIVGAYDGEGYIFWEKK